MVFVVKHWIFKSYLSNRSQYVEYDNCLSDFIKVNCGIPQGSVLGPILFLIYINYLPNISKHFKTIRYADDINLIFSNDTYLD